MKTTLHYLFDPLCGWCYGLAPAVSGLLKYPAVNLELLPIGLFFGEGARPLDDVFAAYAWSNDQRIQHLTGQPFSMRYRDRILGDRRQRFDSGPATVALTAVSLTEPARELAALKAIQHARYVDGNDVISLVALADLLKTLGLDDAAAKVEHPDAELLAASRARVNRAQALMRDSGASGAPTLIVESVGRRRVLDHTAAYSNPPLLISQFEAA